jgi:small subunit ribosomal protein S1
MHGVGTSLETHLTLVQRRYNCGGPGPATETGSPARRHRESDVRRNRKAMANVDNGMTPGPGDQPGAPARTRAGKPAGPAFKPMHQERDPQEYAALLDAYDTSFRNMAEGEVVKGTVLKVTDTAVVVDVGYKSEGLISISEFLDETGQVTVQPGDTVDVLLERTEDREGHIVLSREKAEKMKIWDEVEKAYTDRKVVIGRVIERIKGGLAVDIGVRAFLPGSQIDVRPVRNLDALRGQELRMRVIKVNKKRGNIVLSRKALLEEENAEKKKTTLETLAEGKVLRGTVKNITDYGAFIDLGGIDGLLHITDMSWGRVGHPSELFKVNDEVDVIVLKYDPATERVSLGHKQLVQDPWATVQDRYPVGARMSGKVVSLTDYGAFVELEPGVEGLIHVSEMSWSKRVKHPSKILNVGDSVEAMVLGVDPAARRISLGLKQVETNPWHELTEKYPVGTRIKGKVRNLTEFGAFVEVEEDIDGLIHISDMSWSKRIKHPSEVLKKGDVVEAMVLSIDAENQRLSLGLKQLATDIWDDFFSRHHVGDTIEGKVTRMTNFGAFVELDEGIEGLIHVSEFDESHGGGQSGGEKIDLQVGNSYQMKIIKLSPSERKIGLSIRALKSDEFRADWESYSEGSGTGTATLGDHFRNR